MMTEQDIRDMRELDESAEKINLYYRSFGSGFLFYKLFG